MNLRKLPLLNPIINANFSLVGEVGERIRKVVNQWLLPTPISNPAILEMFRDRDRRPLRNMVAYAGEFAGKYLTQAVQIYRLTHDEELKKHIEWFIEELLSLQDEDGYLGPWPKDCHLTGNAPNVEAKDGKTWDAWGHYHIMLGLLFWYDQTADKEVLRCVRKIADMFCAKFLDGGQRLVSTGCEEKNLAPIHSLCLLYERTRENRYLTMAREIERDFEVAPAGDYIRTALAGKEFFQTPKPRWESLHLIQGIAELYFITGEEKYRQAFEHIWWSIVKGDRHNTGGFSSGEAATGNPYNQGAIETCCTIAWMAMSIDMLRMTGNSIVADELELSTLNASIGMMSPSGRWWTYNTPMDGYRKAFYQEHNWQARPGSPELNCCAANGGRSLGILSDWAIMAHENGITLNYYGPGCMKVKFRSGNWIVIEQETDYPRTGEIVIRVSPEAPELFNMRMRIPYWSTTTRVTVNGKAIGKVEPGCYFELERMWRAGDKVQVILDMSLHYWLGEKECEGKSSIYRGPILLAYDPRFNEIEPEDLPQLDATNMKERIVYSESWLKSWLIWEYLTVDGRKLRLCDFASAGMAGNPYWSWLKVKNVPRTEFSTRNPLRSSMP